MINDLIKNCSQNNAESVDYFRVSRRGSETHALQNGNLERLEVFKIEDRVQCQVCFKYQRPGATFCTCGSMLQGISEEVTKQAEQRINSRFIKYVRGILKLALKITQVGRRYGNSAEPEKHKNCKRLLGFRKEAQIHNDRGAPPRGRAAPCVHAQEKDTRNPTWKKLTQ